MWPLPCDFSTSSRSRSDFDICFLSLMRLKSSVILSALGCIYLAVKGLFGRQFTQVDRISAPSFGIGGLSPFLSSVGNNA